MITKPPIDELCEITGNKYVLCCAISRRAKELNDKQNKDEISNKEKTITLAANELYSGKTVIAEK